MERKTHLEETGMLFVLFGIASCGGDEYYNNKLFSFFPSVTTVVITSETLK